MMIIIMHLSHRPHLENNSQPHWHDVVIIRDRLHGILICEQIKKGRAREFEIRRQFFTCSLNPFASPCTHFFEDPFKIKFFLKFVIALTGSETFARNLQIISSIKFNVMLSLSFNWLYWEHNNAHHECEIMEDIK